MMIDIEDVKTLTLKPGQTLVVQAMTLLSSNLRERLRNEFQGLFPDNRVIIIDKDLQLMVIDDERTNSRTCRTG
jgi:hypothetical protein